MKWSKTGNQLIGSKGEVHELWPHEFWYVAPARTVYTPGERIVNPLEFAITLYNARNGEGVACGLDQLLEGIEPTSLKNGVAADAEKKLEAVRQANFPSRPSRLRSYFLNYDKCVAEQRSKFMFRGERMIVRCYLLLSSGRYHFGDIDAYERLEGRPDDDALANKYWETFSPATEADRTRLEVVADSALYFPDWQEFPTLDQNSLVSWMNDNPPTTNR